MKKKKVLLFLCGICVCILGLTGCVGRVKTNDPVNLAEVPYTFMAEKDGFMIAIEVRQMREDDLKLLGTMPEKMTEEDLLKGYRSAIYIGYQGESSFQQLDYTFGKGTQWQFTGTLKAKEGEDDISKYLSGMDNLGGAFYSLDAKIGGPIPPYNTQFEFEVKTVDADGNKVTTLMTLTARSGDKETIDAQKQEGGNQEEQEGEGDNQ